MHCRWLLGFVALFLSVIAVYANYPQDAPEMSQYFPAYGGGWQADYEWSPENTRIKKWASQLRFGKRGGQGWASQVRFG
ncbi:hypothetical protein AAVH_03164 [Aphelenchoides avenae]|nr:hypothetical protein AAVH_03164 [Aphelenchus avenae]